MPGDLQKGNIVAGVFGHGGQDAVAGLEGNCVKGHVPGAGRVLDNGNLVAVRADERTHRVVDMLHRVVGKRRRSITAHFGFEQQMPRDRIHYQLWHERRAGVVEMQNFLTARRVSAGANNVNLCVIRHRMGSALANTPAVTV